MSRSSVTLRAAQPDDAARLVDLWATVLRRCDAGDQVGDVEHVIKQATASPESRLVVAEYDGELAGAVLLRLSTISPINLEPTVQAVSPHVFPQFRRHGVGRALMESVVAFAEELGVAHVATAVTSGSRDGNRFMARLALGPHAVMRVAPAVAVRARLNAQRPVLAVSAGGAGGGRQVTRVLAARRSMRRAQTNS